VGEVFDDISRIVASQIPRRQALKMIAGALVGSIFHLPSPRRANVEKSCQKTTCDDKLSSPCSGSDPPCCCLPGTFCCLGKDKIFNYCCDLKTEDCINGRCVPKCPEGKSRCGDDCCARMNCIDNRCCHSLLVCTKDGKPTCCTSGVCINKGKKDEQCCERRKICGPAKDKYQGVCCQPDEKCVDNTCVKCDPKELCDQECCNPGETCIKRVDGGIISRMCCPNKQVCGPENALSRKCCLSGQECSDAYQCCAPSQICGRKKRQTYCCPGLQDCVDDKKCCPPG
jgi:hypothetical protein